MLSTGQDQAIVVTDSKHTWLCSPNMQILPGSENNPLPTILRCIKKTFRPVNEGNR